MIRWFAVVTWSHDADRKVNNIVVNDLVRNRYWCDETNNCILWLKNRLSVVVSLRASLGEFTIHWIDLPYREWSDGAYTPGIHYFVTNSEEVIKLFEGYNDIEVKECRSADVEQMSYEIAKELASIPYEDIVRFILFALLMSTTVKEGSFIFEDYEKESEGGKQ